MSFTYTRDIPATNNNPSSDQPNMKENTNSIDDLIAVDHVSFGNATGGLHKQVHYVSNQAAPGVGSAVGVEFVNSVAGLLGTVSSLFFQNGTSTKQLTNLALTTSGTNYSITTPWGLILNFGFNAGAATSNAITFSTAFSTSVLAVFMTLSSNSASGSQLSVRASPGPSTTGFTGILSTAGFGFYYLAIGY
ncbi:MAG: hypothetical protein KGZ39_00310 [Simkania sp.]|nr:hypothetical protein [Simkania sp.]